MVGNDWKPHHNPTTTPNANHSNVRTWQHPKQSTCDKHAKELEGVAVCESQLGCQLQYRPCPTRDNLSCYTCCHAQGRYTADQVLPTACKGRHNGICTIGTPRAGGGGGWVMMIILQVGVQWHDVVAALEFGRRCGHVGGCLLVGGGC